jgi:CelD/BcsL family acetyltransferase involved in cellulose biosynthesis
LWCSAWQDTAAKDRDPEVRIVIGHGADGSLRFILPLQIRKAYGVKVLEWMTSPLASYGYGVFDSWGLSITGQDWFTRNFSAIFGIIGGIDVISLREMPYEMHSRAHPLQDLVNIAAPNCAYAIHLGQDYETLLTRKRSADSRKNIRWRDNKLHSAGDLKFENAFNHQDHHAYLDEMLDDQARRLAESGVTDPFGARERAFFHRLVEVSRTSHTQVSVRRLSLNGQGLSSILAGNHFDTCTDIITSLAQSPHRKFSPGDKVLRCVIADSCKSGHKIFDLSIGVADYKLQWCDETIKLGHMIKANSAKGFAAALLHYCEQSLKRLSKKSLMFRNLYFATRRNLKRVKPLS